MTRKIAFALPLALAALLPLAATANTPESAFQAELLKVGAQGCPPGLAKKSPSCVPPGLAKKMAPYAVGDRLDPRRDGIYLLRDPSVYGLDRHRTYYRVGDHRIALVDNDTMKILRLIDAVNDVLN
ncbi:excinuclease ABC subunit A [Pseudooceanicola sp. CBS1P-1]|uniref:Excinuclease ABC subunit A n=1 Tax=Pseudooceanicola albus TaxID=2692189 RepID=A0A6L7GAF5_9RHOB|nr:MULTISPECIES: excinuclease ABC subunit A [Pseudooceanicola]MBT9384437.1 excinuclease ABC subunit A [Pseudooceanicola endophyticus]MXN20662.1 excinuclease ABC subunit A [Pseudooceanicola albus]